MAQIRLISILKFSLLLNFIVTDGRPNDEVHSLGPLVYIYIYIYISLTVYPITYLRAPFMGALRKVSLENLSIHLSQCLFPVTPCAMPP